MDQLLWVKYTHILAASRLIHLSLVGCDNTAKKRMSKKQKFRVLRGEVREMKKTKNRTRKAGMTPGETLVSRIDMAGFALLTFLIRSLGCGSINFQRMIDDPIPWHCGCSILQCTVLTQFAVNHSQKELCLTHWHGSFHLTGILDRTALLGLVPKSPVENDILAAGSRNAQWWHNWLSNCCGMNSQKPTLPISGHLIFEYFWWTSLQILVSTLSMN